MRITGGMLAGRTIQCPPGVIRPAMDRMRESCFAVLGDMSGTSFLDLFSGSGSIAIEAASRGAAVVELCEKDRTKIQTILKNVAVTERELGVKIRCHFMPVEYFLKRCHRQFDCIFFDPPFPYQFHEALLQLAEEKKILAAGGRLLIHRPQEKELPQTIGTLIRTDQRTYGRSIVDFYREKNAPVPLPATTVRMEQVFPPKCAPED
ncbi:MAG: 16S rRNA (guanine(966)-N(2))-methyltransferase RsmD [Treponema sp.]|nr:16S rRNA (guanine(966)-N(2))-methyltransferase RsmD [Treponema sp.]